VAPVEPAIQHSNILTEPQENKQSHKILCQMSNQATHPTWLDQHSHGTVSVFITPMRPHLRTSWNMFLLNRHGITCQN